MVHEGKKMVHEEGKKMVHEEGKTMVHGLRMMSITMEPGHRRLVPRDG